MILLGIDNSRAELESGFGPVQPEFQLFRKSPRLKENCLQLVPPELTLHSDAATYNKGHSGNLIPLQDRFGVVKIISIAVIEGHQYATPGYPAIPNSLAQFAQ